MSLPIALVCSLLLCSTHVIAQAKIRNSSPTNNEASQSVVPANDSLVYEIQALQQEIQNLRGQLEKQGYDLKRLKQQRLDDYLDLDKRIGELNKQRTLPIVSTSPEDNSTGIDVPTSNTAPALSLASVNHQQSDALYDEVIDLLLNKQDYTGAQSKFSEYLTRYPEGKFTPNVYYWQGQIWFAGAEKVKAASIFEKLITSYPDHQKVPDAKFKLARIYFDQGKKEDARRILEQVAISDSDAALLAKSFISKNYK